MQVKGTVSAFEAKRLALWGLGVVFVLGVVYLGKIQPGAAAQGFPGQKTLTATVPPTILSPTETPTITLTPTNTSTPTMTPTVTPTSTPRPVRLPLLFRFRVGKPLLNGGFESGALLPGWEDGGVLPRSIVPDERHSGRYAVLLGSRNHNCRAAECPVGEAAIWQVADIPAEGHSTLRFWYKIASYDTIEFDYFLVQVSDWPTGASVKELRDGRTVWDYSLWVQDWKEGLISLDEYRGHTVLIRFANVMTNDDGWYNTWSYVDDVSIENRP